MGTKFLLPIFLFLIFLNFSLATTITLSNNLACNAYKYVNDQDGSLQGSPHIAMNCVQLCNGNTNISVPAGDCSGYANTQRVVMNNLGWVTFQGYWGGGGSWVDTGDCLCGTATPYTIPSSSVCSNGVCDFYYAEGLNKGNQGCDKSNSSNVVTSQIHLDLGLGCAIPSLIQNLPSGGNIQSDRYRFDFNITHDSGWTGVGCQFTLQGTPSTIHHDFVIADMSGVTDNKNIVIDVLFTSYPKQFTTAKLECSYNTHYNQSELFYSHFWLVDSFEQYKIADMDSNIGHATIIPNKLLSWQDLNAIRFEVIGATNKLDYGMPIIATITTNTDLTTLGCTNNTINQTLLLNPIQTGGALTCAVTSCSYYQLPYYFVWALMNISHFISCPATTFPVTLSVKNLDSLSMDSLTFNLTWANGGEMLIDNINLIKNPSHGKNLELYVAVTTDYSRTAIPAIANLTCSYNTSNLRTLENISGDMIWSNDGELINSTMKNDSVATDASAIRGDEYNITINCSADGYTTTTINAYQLVGTHRVRDFFCTLSNSPLTFPSDNAWQTDPTTITCLIDIDTKQGIFDNATELSYLKNNFKDLFVNTLIRNIAAGRDLITAIPCTDDAFMSYGDVIPQYGGDMLQTHASKVAQFTWKNPATCELMFLKLAEGHYARYLVSFNPWMPELKGWENGSAMVQGTSAIISFDLSKFNAIQAENPTLAILNKTINNNLVETNDTLSCQITYKPFNYSISNIFMWLVDASGRELCYSGGQYIHTISPTIQAISNDTYLASGLFKINNTNCPNWDYLTNGTLACEVSIDYYSRILYATSNYLPYQNLANINATLNETPNELWGTWDDFMNGVYNDFRNNPLLFFLKIFIIVISMPVIIFILYIVSKYI